MCKPSLVAKNNKLWITYQPLEKKLSGCTKHLAYLCPMVRNGFPCIASTRSDTTVAHQCQFYTQQRSITSYVKSQSSADPEENNMLTPEEERYRSIIMCLAECNIPFNALRKPAFQQMLTLLYSPLTITGGLPPVPKFSHDALVKTLISLGKKQKNTIIESIQGKTITVMIDGGKIGKNYCTSITLLPHEGQTGPIFWELGPSCRTKEDYLELANAIIREMDAYSVHVFAFCTDGLSSQRGALISDELISSKVIPMLRPQWIYCGNHLTNLVVQKSIASDPDLNKLSELIRDFSRSTRNTKDWKAIGGICPGFVITRWLVLEDICTFIRTHEDAIMKSGLLNVHQLFEIMQLEVLLLPLMDLHHKLESNDCRLSDVFPLILRTIQQYDLITKNKSIREKALHGVRIILTNLYKRFMFGERGDLYAIAYVLTPKGLEEYHKHKFSWHAEAYPEPLSVQKKLGFQTPAGGPFAFNSICEAYVELLKKHVSTNPEQIQLTVPDPPSKGAKKTRIQLTELLQKLSTADRLARDHSDSATSSEEKNNRSDDAQLDDTVDILGIIEATLASDGDEYVETSSSHIEEASMTSAPADASATSSCSSSSSSSSCSSTACGYNLRPGKTVIVIEDDSDDPVLEDMDEGMNQADIASETPPAHATTQSDPEKTQALLDLPRYTNDSREYEYIKELQSLFFANWPSRLREGYKSLISCIIRDATPELLGSFRRQFVDMLTPSPHKHISLDPYRFHYQNAETSTEARLFSFVNWCILSAGSSEASCERVFSDGSWIVGNRRGQLKLEVITYILHILRRINNTSLQ